LDRLGSLGSILNTAAVVGAISVVWTVGETTVPVAEPPEMSRTWLMLLKALVDAATGD
jgi:hypothetical protein